MNGTTSLSFVLLSDAAPLTNAMTSRSLYFRSSFTTGSPGMSPVAQNVCKSFNFSLPGKYVCPDWYNFSCSRMTLKYGYAENCSALPGQNATLGELTDTSGIDSRLLR